MDFYSSLRMTIHHINNIRTVKILENTCFLLESYLHGLPREVHFERIGNIVLASNIYAK